MLALTVNPGTDIAVLGNPASPAQDGSRRRFRPTTGSDWQSPSSDRSRRDQVRYQRVNARRYTPRRNVGEYSSDPRIRTYLENSRMHLVEFDWHTIDVLV